MFPALTDGEVALTSPIYVFFAFFFGFFLVFFVFLVFRQRLFFVFVWFWCSYCDMTFPVPELFWFDVCASRCFLRDLTNVESGSGWRCVLVGWASFLIDFE